MTRPHAPLPPGQRERDDFPRFGMSAFAPRFPAEPARIAVRCGGALQHEITLDAELLGRLPRVEQRSDFHCVTTWSRRGLLWSGHRFADVYRELLQPLERTGEAVTLVVLRGEDGYRAELPLADLLAPEVLLADRLDGKPLGVDHGAPLRLVAPAHYGYKNVKHLRGIELRVSREGYRPLGPAFMSHERARVALEERGRFVPGWLLRHLYRPLVRPTVALFERASRARQVDGAA